jgi:hypothetical protein
MTERRPLRTRQDVQAYRPCALCGQTVLHGVAPDGQLVPLDVGVVCYVVLWPNETQLPALSLSRAYPVHRCPGSWPDGASILR